MTDWPHQIRGVEQTKASIARGERRICLTSPTGGGKSRMACRLIKEALDEVKKVVMYTNRRLMTEQTSGVFEAAGLTHGIRSAGYQDERWCDLQIASIQTEHSRTVRRGQRTLHDADLVIVDEAHLNKGEAARAILDAHHADGAAIVGLTATPIDLTGMYDTLVVAGTNSELRKCGALVPAIHYGCDEPDLKRIKGLRMGEDLTESQNRMAMGQARNGQADKRLCQMFGRVIEWYEKLNREHRPTILFAPGVAESRWFAEQFCSAGISAAHIDGQEVWINGRLEKTSRQAREDAIGGSQDGSVKVLCNRFVLREGIDAPWLDHGIFACVFGSVQSYLQSGGRLLRAHPSLDHVTIQDHGGHWWRAGLGSLNADRYWDLSLSGAMICGIAEDRLRAKKDREPVRCPRCGMILTRRVCPCGYEAGTERKSRPVVQSDGTLKEMIGDIYRPRRLYVRPNMQDLWTKMYWRARNARWDATFRQAEAMFAQENNWCWPPRTLRFMPLEEDDFWRKVKDVPMDRLRR